MAGSRRNGAAGPRLGMGAVLAVVILAGGACATPKLPAPPPKYVTAPQPEIASANSLWTARGSLYEDPRARRLNDLVTIKILESTTASGKADTNTSRDSSFDASVADFLGLPLSASINKGRYNLTPTASGAMTDHFKGSGATTREGTLVGTITAKVVEVMPNGNLVLESRKDITVNNEKQILVLRGTARPNDIQTDNTLPSTRLADADVYFVGDGVIQEKQRPGWLGRFLGLVWPF